MRPGGPLDGMITFFAERHRQADNGQLILELPVRFHQVRVHDSAVVTGVVKEADDRIRRLSWSNDGHLPQADLNFPIVY